MRTYEQALALAARRGTRVLRGTADMYVGLAALHVERDDLVAARSELGRARAVGEHAGLPQHPYRWRVAMAQVSAAEGELEAAVGLLDEAERRYEADFSPEVRPVAALRARLWIRQGRADAALAWAESRGLSPDDDLGYVHEYEHVTLARALVADRAGDRVGQALDLLGRLLGAARDGGRVGSVIEILVVEALAHQRLGDDARAIACLEAALDLGEAEGHAAAFRDEGAPMAALLSTAAGRGTPSPYRRGMRVAPATGPGTSNRPDLAMLDPLSSRERDVLRFLGTELNGPEIARELVVSLNTVRTHTKSIYLKLGVNNRRAAVRRARDLDLL